MIRHFQAGLHVEVGAGYSTLIARIRVFTQQPYVTRSDRPVSASLSDHPGPGPGHSGYREGPKSPLPAFRRWGRTIILFIDSTHVSKIGSAVTT